MLKLTAGATVLVAAMTTAAAADCGLTVNINTSDINFIQPEDAPKVDNVFTALEDVWNTMICDTINGERKAIQSETGTVDVKAETTIDAVNRFVQTMNVSSKFQEAGKTGAVWIDVKGTNVDLGFNPLMSASKNGEAGIALLKDQIEKGLAGTMQNESCTYVDGIASCVPGTPIAPTP